jgi:hypothetical protein
VRDVLVSLGCHLSDQSLGGAPAQGSQQRLYDRMLLFAELVGMEVGGSTDDGDSSKLGLGC